MKNQISLVKFDIDLPDETNSEFYIFHDLAELFGTSYQNDAVKKLKKELKKVELKPKPSVSYESDYTSIRSRSPETILQVAKTIVFLSTSNNKIKHEENDWLNTLEKLKNWKRPKGQNWKIGDILSVELKDGSFCFAQILGNHPTLALIDHKSSTVDLDINILFNKNIITILHLHSMQIKNRTWKIIGNSGKLVANQNDGPWGETDGKNAIESATGNWLQFDGNVYYKLDISKKERYEPVIMKRGWIDKLKMNRW